MVTRDKHRLIRGEKIGVKRDYVGTKRKTDGPFTA